MQFSIEKKISNFVESQFPQFYQDEGPNFILFVKAYYEWLETEGGVTYESRNLLDYRDIDNTLPAFLEFFQRKYLYGIPFQIIANKQFLLKHILDVYRSKGSIQCYKLLFKLIYNQDVEVYLPGQDILKTSDGTWIQPKYLEVTDSSLSASFVGKNIVGLSSNTTAVVESYITQPVTSTEVATFYISNVLPKGGSFTNGEKIIEVGNASNTLYIEIAPSIIGSLDSISVLNGGQDFNVGDILKVVNRDVTTGKPTSTGSDGLLRVIETSTGQGQLSFDISNHGFGFTTNSHILIYNGDGDTTGVNASFNIGAISYLQNITYNTDIISDYYSLSLDASSWGFPKNNATNSASTIASAFSYANQTFGSVAALTNISTGNSYTQTPNIFIRNFQNTNNHYSNVQYSTSSNTIVGTNTNFDILFANGDAVYMQANTLSATGEYQIIKTVNSNTSITLYGPPAFTGNNASGGFIKVAPVVLPSNFGLGESVMIRADGTINGLNAIVDGFPSSGSGVVSKAVAVDSGKGYLDGATIKAYLYSALSIPVITNGGTLYTNNDVLIFSGGGTNSPAKGYVTTDTSGVITAAILTYSGSGYVDIPAVSVDSKTGSGAVLSTTITDLNLFSSVTGKVVKAGMGKKQGYWSTTRGFLNSDKYIQDSYFYQDFSYQIKVAQTLDNYKNILYDTFHTSGAELFGQYSSLIKESSTLSIISETPTAIIS